MSSINVLSQSVSIERFILGIISREPVVRVRDIQSTIGSTLERSEYAASSGRLPQSNIKEDFKWSPCFIDFLSKGMTAIRLNNTLILVRKTDFCQGPTSNKETGGISSRPILETVIDTVFW